jgi:hypothetical protein
MADSDGRTMVVVAAAGPGAAPAWLGGPGGPGNAALTLCLDVNIPYLENYLSLITFVENK